MAPTRRSVRSEAALAAKTHAALDHLAEVAAEEPQPQPQPQPQEQEPQPRRGAALPGALQFPLAAGMSFALASLGYSIVGELSQGELVSVSRLQDTWGEVAVLAGWRV